MDSDIQKAIESLARSRAIEAEYKTEIKEIQAEMSEMPLGKRLAHVYKLLAVAQEDVADAEIAVRSRALKMYDSTGAKQPHPAVKIAVYTVLSYDPAQALEYARQHLPKALKLDKQVFEKSAKAIEPDFVIVGEEARVRIASDLSEYLKGGNERCCT